MTIKREVVVTRTTVASVIGAIAVALTLVGVPMSDHTQQEVIDGVMSGLALLPVAAGLIVRRKVTPVADPKSADGKPLVPWTPHEITAIPEPPHAPADPPASLSSMAATPPLDTTKASSAPPIPAE